MMLHPYKNWTRWCIFTSSMREYAGPVACSTMPLVSTTHWIITLVDTMIILCVIGTKDIADGIYHSLLQCYERCKSVTIGDMENSDYNLPILLNSLKKIMETSPFKGESASIWQLMQDPIKNLETKWEFENLMLLLVNAGVNKTGVTTICGQLAELYIIPWICSRTQTIDIISIWENWRYDVYISHLPWKVLNYGNCWSSHSYVLLSRVNTSPLFLIHARRSVITITKELLKVPSQIQ